MSDVSEEMLTRCLALGCFLCQQEGEKPVHKPSLTKSEEERQEHKAQKAARKEAEREAEREEREVYTPLLC